MTAHTRPLVSAPDEHAIEVAARVVASFQRGAALGNWDDFIDLLRDDVRIMIPVPGFEGVNVGKDRAREMFASHHEEQVTGAEFECKRIAANGSLVMVECRVEGDLAGRPSANGLLFVFEIDGDKLAAMYEYAMWTDKPDSSPWNDVAFARDAFDGVEPAIPFPGVQALRA